MPVLDLVDCIKPGSVVYDNVASGTDEEVRERERERERPAWQHAVTCTCTIIIIIVTVSKLCLFWEE